MLCYNKGENEVIPLNERELSPTILQTKEELMKALDDGILKSAKYNILKEDEKKFVSLIAFAGYKGYQAIKKIRPKAHDPYSMANRWAARPIVADALEELTYLKNKKWAAELTDAREIALRKLMYIMADTEDEQLQALVAKTILAESREATKQPKVTEEVSGFRFIIETPDAPMKAYNPNEEIVMPTGKMTLNYAKKTTIEE